MKSKLLFGTMLCASALINSTAASAAKLSLAPVEESGVQMRFNRSVPTVQRDDEQVTVTVTPLELNRGRFAFAIAAFNKAPNAFNLGVENVTVRLADGTLVKVLTKDELVKQAKKRAMWAQVGMALATGLSAAAVASTAGQHNYNSTLRTPNGTYRYSGTYVNQTERLLATSAVTAGGGYAVASIQSGLDNLVANLGENVLQTSTIDPGSGYGGSIVLDKIDWKPSEKGSKAKLTDQNLFVTVNANGKQYPFTFDIR
ncbi:MAG: hypothetical protein LH466_06145 [Sphingomonas bacterium]|nr:hypothetical protein [Sphingomonas bacterium]